MTYTSQEARDIVVEWLHNGGEPTAELPVKYKYINPRVMWEEREHCLCGCAGAVMVMLVVFGKACDVHAHGCDIDNDNIISLCYYSLKWFGDDDVFFNLTEKGVDNEASCVAVYLEGLEFV